jgi:putative endonuclease
MLTCFVYVMASRSRTLYIGMTSDLPRRVVEHKQKIMVGFTAKYRIDRLVYVEETADVHAAIAREKQLKGWTRPRKMALIETANPAWDDLASGWGSADPSLRSG